MEQLLADVIAVRGMDRYSPESGVPELTSKVVPDERHSPLGVMLLNPPRYVEHYLSDLVIRQIQRC